jgi:amino acid adenylation domain-containing protein
MGSPMLDVLARIDALPPERRRAAYHTLLHDGERYDVHPLTSAQQWMWLLAEMRPDSPAYHVTYRVDIEGGLHPGALERALTALVARHEALRTVFVSLDGELRRVVLPPGTGIRLPVRELAPESAAALTAEQTHRPFDLARGPLLRATLARTGRQAWLLLLSLHHIVCDGWSMGILFEELSALYAAHLAGRPVTLPSLPRLADVQRRLESTVADQRPVDYWRAALSGAPQTLDLPTDRPRPALLDETGGQVAVSWPAGLARRLSEFARATGTTPYMVLVAAATALLHRYTGQQDLLVGTPVAGRTSLDSEGLVGFFVNTQVLRTRLDDRLPFAALLEQVRETTLDGLAHQGLAFDRLVDLLGAERDPSRTPLFQVMLAAEDAWEDRLVLPGLTVRSRETHTGTAMFDLTITFVPRPDRIDVRLEYRTSLFEASTLARLADRLRVLLSAALAGPACPLGDLPLLTPAGSERLLAGAGTAPAVADPRPVTDLVAERADRAPDAPAVGYRGVALSYRDLDQAANRLAHLLVARRVRPETPVGVCLTPCPDLAVAFLGVLRSGGVYVPLDPTLPPARLHRLVTEAGVRLLLTDAGTAAALPATGVPTLRLDDRAGPAAALPVTRPPVALTPEHAAYLIYTSGSTGRPKGVVGTHRALRNLAEAQRVLLQVRPDDRVAQFHSPGFDVALSELLTALCAGAELRLVPSGEHEPGAGLARALREQEVTVADLPPVVLAAMDPAELPALRSLTVGGEPCPPDVAAAWGRGRELVNAYGATETGVTATAGRYPGGPNVPIGRPVPGARAYVLDRRLRPVPAGVTGELYVAGAGLARGYLGDPALTATRFLPDPFGDPGRRMYRTGDLARWRFDGELEFLGRADDQLKIRGYRIEPAEVEAKLRACAGVRQAAVVAREDQPGHRRLVGYLVGDPARLEVDALRAELRRELPEYLVPTAFVVVPRLPLTPAGKLDRGALPAPSTGRPPLGTPFVAPRNPTEEAIAAVWRETLALTEIGVHDNFFDLGGSSLLLAKARARLVDALAVEVSAVELFRHPTVALLARSLGAGGSPPQPPDPDARDPEADRRRAVDRRSALAERARRVAADRGVPA